MWATASQEAGAGPVQSCLADWRYRWLLSPSHFLSENVFNSEHVSARRSFLEDRSCHRTQQRDGSIQSRLRPDPWSNYLAGPLLGPCPGCNQAFGPGGEEEPWGGREKGGCPDRRASHSPLEQQYVPLWGRVPLQGPGVAAEATPPAWWPGPDPSPGPQEGGAWSSRPLLRLTGEPSCLWVYRLFTPNRGPPQAPIVPIVRPGVPLSPDKSVSPQPLAQSTQ